jgi:hypothetical protein
VIPSFPFLGLIEVWPVLLLVSAGHSYDQDRAHHYELKKFQLYKRPTNVVPKSYGKANFLRLVVDV